jgi:predicted nucleotidyltransferase
MEKKGPMHIKERQRDIEEIVRRLSAEYKPDKIVLFGSSGDDSADETSDVDLLIVKETDDRFIDRWMVVRRILSDPRRRFGLDAIILTSGEIRERLSKGDQFLKRILETGRVLYEA